MAKDKYVAYVGTYTHENSRGIHVYDVDPDTGVFKLRGVAEINNPSYLTVSRDGKTLYSIADEGVASFAIDENGDLTKTSQKWIGGMRGDFVEVDSKNRYLFVGGYHDGRVTMMRLNPDETINGIAFGIFHKGSAIGFGDPHFDHAKVTCVRLTPDEKFLCAVDFGLNQVKVYRIDYDLGNLTMVDIIRPEIDAGAREIRFSKDGKFAYVLTGINNSIEVYRYSIDDRDEPVFEKVQQVSVLNQKYEAAASLNMCFTSKEDYIFVAIDALNAVTAMKRDPETGFLTYDGITYISGEYPKSIVTLPGDKFLVVANHDTNDIRTFEINEKGHYCLMKNAPVKIHQPNRIHIHRLR
jgi:6-phosphogluconolactonase